MEGYLGTLFNHGAVLVNVFGWGEGDESNPFRKIAEGSDALAAYRKFLDAAKLGEAQFPIFYRRCRQNIRVKIQKVQAALPVWVQATDLNRSRITLKVSAGRWKTNDSAMLKKLPMLS
jgi:hypothetical protein